MAKVSFTAALSKLASALAIAHDIETAALGKATEQRKMAINQALDAGRAADTDAGTIRDGVIEALEKAVELGQLAKATARAYATGVRFAIERRVAWSPALHSAEGQAQALTDAGKALPKALSEKLEATAKKKEAAAGKANVASDDSVIRHLAKALVDARALGRSYAPDILDIIHSIKPEWKEPEAAPM